MDALGYAQVGKSASRWTYLSWVWFLVKGGAQVCSMYVVARAQAKGAIVAYDKVT